MIAYYVLSLEKDVARRHLFYQQTESQVFQTVYGVDKQSLSSFEYQFDATVAHQRYRRSITLGEQACACSHIKIYQTFLQESEAQWAVICEDDALLHPHFQEITTILQQQRSFADILVISGFKGQTFTSKWNEKQFKYPLQLCPQKIQHYHLGYLFKNYMCMAVGYVISRAFAQQVIDYVQHHPITWLADDFATLTQLVHQDHQNHIVHVFPRLVMESTQAISNLEQERNAGHTKKKRRLLSRLNFYVTNGILYPFKRIIAWVKYHHLYRQSKP